MAMSWYENNSNNNRNLRRVLSETGRLEEGEIGGDTFSTFAVLFTKLLRITLVYFPHLVGRGGGGFCDEMVDGIIMRQGVVFAVHVMYFRVRVPVARSLFQSGKTPSIFL